MLMPTKGLLRKRVNWTEDLPWKWCRGEDDEEDANEDEEEKAVYDEYVGWHEAKLVVRHVNIVVQTTTKSCTMHKMSRWKPSAIIFNWQSRGKWEKLFLLFLFFPYVSLYVTLFSMLDEDDDDDDENEDEPREWKKKTRCLHRMKDSKDEDEERGWDEIYWRNWLSFTWNDSLHPPSSPSCPDSLTSWGKSDYNFVFQSSSWQSKRFLWRRNRVSPAHDSLDVRCLLFLLFLLSVLCSFLLLSFIHFQCLFVLVFPSFLMFVSSLFWVLSGLTCYPSRLLMFRERIISRDCTSHVCQRVFHWLDFTARMTEILTRKKARDKDRRCRPRKTFVTLNIPMEEWLFPL